MKKNNKTEKCSDKLESSFTLFGALKMKNINKMKKTTTNGKRYTNKIVVTVSHVATALVIHFVDQTLLAI